MERHDVKFRVDSFGRESLDFKFAGRNPFDKFPDAFLDAGGVLGFFEFTANRPGNCRASLCV